MLLKFVRLCMINGKKSKSHLILKKTLNQLANYDNGLKSSRKEAQGMAFLMKAVDNVKPILEVKKIRIAGSTQLVPSIISQNRQESIAIRWLVEAAKKRRNAKKSLDLSHCLVAELVDAFNKTGVVRKKRDELHKLAEANRGFAHYRWW